MNCRSASIYYRTHVRDAEGVSRSRSGTRRCDGSALEAADLSSLDDADFAMRWLPPRK